MAEKKRRARGEGSIRQRKDGTLEARFVAGVDPGTGKDIRKSVYAKTQKEVRKKMTVGQWLDVWAAEYLGGVKPMTVLNYSQHIKNHIKPTMGAIITSAIRRSELIASEYSKKRNPPRLLMALIMLMCIFLAWTFTTGVFPFGA